MRRVLEENRRTSAGFRRRLLWLLTPGMCLIAVSFLFLWNWQVMLLAAIEGVDGWVLGMLSGSASGGPSSSVAQPPDKFVPLADDALLVVSMETDTMAGKLVGSTDEIVAGAIANREESDSMNLLAAAAVAGAGATETVDGGSSARVLGRVVLAGVAIEGVKASDVYELRAGHLQRMLLMPNVNGQFELAGMFEGGEVFGEGKAGTDYGRLRLDAATGKLDVVWRASAGIEQVKTEESLGQELTAVFLQGSWKDVIEGRAVELEPGELVEEQFGRLLAGEVATAVRSQFGGVSGVDANRLDFELLSVPRSCLKIHGNDLRWVLRSPVTVIVSLRPMAANR